jgi:shikimate dehydrogenase
MAGFDPLPLPQALLETLDRHPRRRRRHRPGDHAAALSPARGCVVQTGPEMALAQMKLMGQFIGAIPQEQGAAA